MNDEKNRSRLERLRHVLEIHGADPQRWPEAERDELVRFADTDPSGAAALREAAALDKLLALAAPGRDDDEDTGRTEALAGRILGDFQREQARKQAGSVNREGGNVVAFPAARRNERPAAGASKATRMMASRRTRWGAAMALAASFLIGLYIGGSGVGGVQFDQLNPFVTTTQNSEQVADVGGLIVGTGLEEDLL